MISVEMYASSCLNENDLHIFYRQLYLLPAFSCTLMCFWSQSVIMTLMWREKAGEIHKYTQRETQRDTQRCIDSETQRGIHRGDTHVDAERK